MLNYKTQIRNATSDFELSCIWEDIRNAFYNKKSITLVAKEARSKEIDAKRRELNKRKGMNYA